MDTLRFGTLGTLVILAACSGGSGARSTPAISAAQATPGAAGKTRATLTVVIPQATTVTAAHRRPQYVSPSSAVLSVAVNSGVAASYGLTASSPGCASQAGNLDCTFSIVAPAGHDTLALQLRDGGGNVLSENVVSVTVAAGTTTPVSVTLAAVPASVIVVPGANAVIDSAAPPYHAPGLGAQPIEVEALDADGNVIIGPGAPSIGSVTVSSGASYASVVSAQTTDPAAFLLKPVDGTAGGQNVGVSATVQGIPLADGTTSAPITNSTSYLFTPAMAIGSGPNIGTYSIESGREITRFSVCSGGCPTTIVSGLASDSKGDLYASYTEFLGIQQSSAVNEYAPGATAPSTSLGTSQGVHAVAGLAVDSNNLLYVLNGNIGSFFGGTQRPPTVTEYTFGATTPSYTIANTPAQPTGIAVDTAGNVYVSDPYATDTIIEYPPNAQTSNASLSDPSLAQPGPLVFGAGGIYVADQANNDIAYFAAGQTALTTTLSDGSFGGGLQNLLFDPSGNLWVSIVSPVEIERLAAGGLPNTVTANEYILQSGAMAWIP